MDNKLVVIVGESGSGKTTIVKELEKDGYYVVPTFTTRAPREKDEWGHIFVSKDTYMRVKALDEKKDFPIIIAETFFDGNYYWTERKQIVEHDVSILVVDPPGVTCLRNLLPDVDITVIHIKVDESERYKRMVCAGRSANTTSQRLNHDREMFRVIDCDYCINNNDEDVQKTANIIKSLI